MATEAFDHAGEAVEVPRDRVEDWKYEVSCEDTFLGLADWYQHRLEAEAE